RNWGAMDGVFAAKLAGVPALIHSEHGRDEFNMRGESPRRGWGRRLMFRLSGYVFTVSGEVPGFFSPSTGFPFRPIGTIPNGVDLQRFSGSAADGRAARTALGLDADTFVLGTVGRLDAVKDQMTLLRATQRLRALHPRTHALIVGDGPLRSPLETYVRAE